MATSTLLFKFNGFNDISGSGGRLFSDEYSDVTTKGGEWKVTPPPEDNRWRGATTRACAQDRRGNLWGLKMIVDYFHTHNNEVSPDLDIHEYKLFTRKVESSNINEARKLGYSVQSRITMRVRDASGVVFKERKYVTDAEGTIVYDNDREKEWGIRFIDGAGARSLLRDDALIIEMVVEDDTASLDSLNLPKSSLVNNALQLLDSGDDADVTFDVNGSIIHSHKLILKINAKQLHSFFSSGNSVKVEGTTPELFRFMLRYVYGDDRPDDFDHLVENYKGIIDISDRFNIIGLKIKAEAAKIASLSIDKDNVTEVLLFAHNKNCYLLKEYATQVYSANFYELVNSDA